VSLFRQVVDYYYDGIIASAQGYFHYEINQNHLLVMIRDLVGHEIAGGVHWKGFCAVAEVTAFHIICNIVAHAWPPKVMCNEFHCLPSSRVSSYHVTSHNTHVTLLTNFG